MYIHIRDIPHKKQRYPTVGDWCADGGKLSDVLVSTMNNQDYEFLVALHELIEGYLCVKREVTDEEVTQFDVIYEAMRKPEDNSEPGDNPNAPYHYEHVFATKVERMMAKELGVDWSAYEAAISSL